MFQPLEDAAEEFATARDDYAAASKAQSAEAAIPALLRALRSADAILSFLGYVEPYECGDCDACQANAAARRDAMQTAVNTDPDLSPAGPLGAALSADENASARALLESIFGAFPDGESK